MYSLGPVFRADPSVDVLHLSEFYMLEVELAFVDNLESLLDVSLLVEFFFEGFH